jgi:hypothetical protein
MALNIGGDFEIVDCSNGAHLRLAEGTVLEAYPPETFLHGLARPWMGMHTINIVRRDAAAQGVWFKTRPAGNKKDAIVTLVHEKDSIRTDLVYTIDMENDIIKDIRFDVQGRTKGSLTFSYLQDISEVGDEFIEPAISPDPQVRPQQSRGMLWLVDMARGHLWR